jgi:hypothetical protein
MLSSHEQRPVARQTARSLATLMPNRRAGGAMSAVRSRVVERAGGSVSGKPESSGKTSRTMSAAMASTHGVMEEGGSSNLHAEIPAGGGSLALPYLEQAAQSCALSPESNAIVIADYGSSQGKNSLSPMHAAIRCRGSCGPARQRFQYSFRSAAQGIGSDMRWMTLVFSRVPLEDRSTRASFHKDKLISAGALMLPSGSAVFLL